MPDSMFRRRPLHCARRVRRDLHARHEALRELSVSLAAAINRIENWRM